MDHEGDDDLESTDSVVYIHHPKREDVIKYVSDPLYTNSIFIILTTFSNSGFGYFFWLLAAKFYPREDIGVGAALISAMTFILLLSKLGLDTAIIRYFPSGNRSGVLSTSIIISIATSIALGSFFLTGIDIWAPDLTILKSRNAIIFVIFLVGSCISSLTANAFIALREVKIRFFQSIIVGSRVLLLIPLAFLGAMGVFGSVGISFIFSAIFAIYFMSRTGVYLQSNIDKGFLKDAFSYSAKNYIINALIASPNLLLPIMVLNVLGAENTAKYYIAFTLSSILFVIPDSVSTSLFVEGSYGESLKKAAIKSTIATLSLLVPLVVAFYIGGGYLLDLIGRGYTETLDLLRLIVISSFFLAIYSIYISIKRVQKDLNNLMILSGLFLILILLMSYLSMPKLGLIGIGYSWLLSYGTITVLIIYEMKRPLLKQIRLMQFT